MEKFIKTSIRERILLNKLIEVKNFQLVKFSKEDSYSKWDAVIMSGNSICLVETKFRTYDLSSFNEWIIQKDKYDFLIEQSKNNNAIPLYINFFKDGILIWNLFDIKEPKWIQGDLPKNSQDIEEKLVSKTIGYLNTNLSERIFIKINWLSITKEIQKIYDEKFK